MPVMAGHMPRATWSPADVHPVAAALSAAPTPSTPAMAEHRLPIEGMTCASCVARVEKALKPVPGVQSAEVNLATESALVRSAASIGFEALRAAVEKAGYATREPVAANRGGHVACATTAAAPATLAWPECWSIVVAAVLTLPASTPRPKPATAIIRTPFASSAAPGCASSGALGSTANPTTQHRTADSKPYSKRPGVDTGCLMRRPRRQLS